MTDLGNGSPNGSSYPIGEWVADPKSRTVVRNGVTAKLSPRAMDVLVYLVKRTGDTVTHEELLSAFWRGAVTSPNAVHKCIAEIRHGFGNGSDELIYIETVPKRGYRLRVPVVFRKPAASTIPRVSPAVEEKSLRLAIQQKGVAEVVWNLVRYADLLITGHLFREAALYLDLYEKFQPDNPRVSLRRQRIAAATVGPDADIALLKQNLGHFPNDLVALIGLVTQLAVIGDFREAERYAARLSECDSSGVLAHGARLNLSVLRGELRRGSDALRSALADPVTTGFVRGMVNLILDDVEVGLAGWRQMDPAFWHLAFRYGVDFERFYTAAVLDDPRYQEWLDEFGMGREWTAYLREKVAELTPLTAVSLGDPAPQKVLARSGSLR